MRHNNKPEHRPQLPLLLFAQLVYRVFFPLPLICSFVSLLQKLFAVCEAAEKKQKVVTDCSITSFLFCFVLFFSPLSAFSARHESSRHGFLCLLLFPRFFVCIISGTKQRFDCSRSLVRLAPVCSVFFSLLVLLLPCRLSKMETWCANKGKARRWGNRSKADVHTPNAPLLLAFAFLCSLAPSGGRYLLFFFCLPVSFELTDVCVRVGVCACDGDVPAMNRLGPPPSPHSTPVFLLFLFVPPPLSVRAQLLVPTYHPSLVTLPRVDAEVKKKCQ